MGRKKVRDHTYLQTNRRTYHMDLLNFAAFWYVDTAIYDAFDLGYPWAIASQVVVKVPLLDRFAGLLRPRLIGRTPCREGAGEGVEIWKEDQ